MGALEQLTKDASTCARCRLSEGRTQVVVGVGHSQADLMFVGEAPGRDEDLKGEPFVGRSGKLLDRLVTEELGIDRSQFYIANVVKCRPPENRDPKSDEIDACWSWLEQQLALIDPRVVVTLGNFATRTLLKTTDGITKLRGHVYEFEGRLLVPTFHPSAALRMGADTVAKIRSDLVRAKRAIAGEVDPEELRQ
jgi:uracil-DNA glycosylase